MKRQSLRTAALFASGVVLGATGLHVIGPLVLAPPRTAAVPPEPAEPGKRRVLYYKNPMGHPDTSPVPKKDSMGMDYVPVYEGEDGDRATVKVSADRIQMLGVRTEAAAPRRLVRTLRATGTVQFDEARQYVVTTRFDGWIERLAVARTGDAVQKGQVLAEFYSHDLHRNQIEHFTAGTRAPSKAEHLDLGPLTRLRNLGIADEDVQRILRDGPSRTLPLRAPASGVVIEKRAVDGMRAAPGDVLFRIADLATVWIVADVFEEDVALIAPGQDAVATLAAYPGRAFPGKVGFIYPAMNAATRTARVRIAFANPDGALLGDMYATVAIATGDAAAALSIPDSAVLDSGTRRVVLVAEGGGRFTPRAIKTGRRGEGYVAVLEGLAEGEKVVVSANFLIDAESNLKAALQGFDKDRAKPGLEREQRQ